jgi:hypothetical protein
MEGINVGWFITAFPRRQECSSYQVGDPDGTEVEKEVQVW